MKLLNPPVLLLVAAVALAACSGSPAPFSDEQIARNNRGVALMGKYLYEDAREVFAELAEQQPDWHDVRVNLAVATLNRQEEGDEARALEIAERVLAEDPGHVRARYVAGLVHFYLGETESALEHFEAVMAAEPGDAHAAYFTAQALTQSGRPQAAVELYERAMALDPYLRSSYYGAALVLRQLGEHERAREYLDAYQRFDNNPRAHLAEFRYTRMGRLAEAVAVSEAAGEAPARDPEGPLFAASTSVASVDGPPAATAMTTVDVDGDGRQDLLLADAAGTRVFLQGESGFAESADHALAGIDGVVAAAWGDIDNDGATDVYLCRRGGNRLLLGGDPGWARAPGADDVADAGDCADAAMIDADHDGDVDLFVVNAGGANELYNNNLDGSWRRLSTESEADLAGGNRASRSILAADLDGDRDSDLVVLHRDPPHQVLINDRLWQYRTSEGFDDFSQSDARAISTGDFNADGQVALAALEADGVLYQWQPDGAGRWQRQRLVDLTLAAADHPAIAVLDLDGSGRPEILIHHAGGFVVVGLSDGAAEVLHSESAALSALVPVLLQPGRGPALAGLVNDGETHELRIWPAGSGRHPFVALAPTGRSERADGMRSNASGIGTGIMLRAGSRWALTDTHDAHSAPGQSLQPVAIGLGGRERADFVRLFWTDGVLQTEMDLAAGEVHRIAETQRQLASCPVLFAHNGERFEYVSDLLGVAGIGFFHAPGEYSDPRPWEFFRFPEGSIEPRDGQYEIKIAEPMEEVAYLDAARLHVYDLPAGWGLTLDERMYTGGGPAPTGQAVFYRDEGVMVPERAINERSEDVTDAVRHGDFEAAPVGQRDRRFLGRLAADHVLTLDFGRVINPDGSAPVLIAEGWVEYPYSQTVFAAWQAGADYRSPTLEAFAGGRWQTVHEHFGYPAGMPREMSLPLAGLPPETTGVRLRSNLEIYWDRLAVVHAQPRPGNVAVHTLAPAQASVARTGFARRDTLDQRRPYYDYSERAPFWDTRYPTGFYTALGPAGPLVSEADNAFAVIGPGDELQLAFADPGPVSAGRRRMVVLEVRGYAKDMDLYTRDGATVGPLPLTAGLGDTARRDALHRQTLSRFQGGY